MLMQNTETGEVRELDAASIPPHKASLWQAFSPPSIDLAIIKADAKTRIGIAAESARSKYITPGSGKAMSYQEVAEEATRFKATNGAGQYPFLQARVNSGRYATLMQAADGTLAIEAMWATVGASIDETEDRAKLAVDNATTAADVEAAIPAEWP